MKQYPDTVSYTPSGAAAQDEYGDFVPAAALDAISSDCRHEPASGSGQIKATDGAVINYSSILYLPKLAPEFPEGAQVTVTVKRTGVANSSFKDTVKRFSRGQMNSRIWL